MNILIVEDDRKLAAMMAKAFAENGFSSMHALDGSEGFLREKTGHFDVVVTDVMMPHMDGFALVKAIRATGDNVPIIVLSAKSDVVDRVRGLEYGADDYLAKPFSITELVARVQAILRRVAGRSDPEALTTDELRLDLMTRKLMVRGQVVELQPLELKLVDYLLRNRGRVVSRTTILEHVWDYSFDPHTNVVECRVSRLRAKLGLRSDGSPFIRTVKGFGYAIAHDLRAPLTRLKVRAEMAAAQEGEKNDFAVEVAADTDTMLGLVNTLLEIARLERAGQAVHEVVDLSVVARQVAELYEPVAESAEVSFSLSTPPVVCVVGERTRLLQAVGNLVDNAIKYTPAGGRVEIVVTSAGVLKVKDSGIGIPAVAQPHIFEKFYRAGNVNAPGDGLGLALVDAIIAVCGGHLTVTSELGQGSTFTVQFRVSPKTAGKSGTGMKTRG